MMDALGTQRCAFPFLECEEAAETCGVCLQVDHYLTSQL